MVAGDDGAGARIARNRKRRGLNQRDFAARVHFSVSTIQKVESGHKPASPALIEAVARALRVPVHELQGQPIRGESPREDAVHASVPAIRRALAGWDMPADIPARPLYRIRPDVRQASMLHLASRYRELGTMLPGLLDELTVAYHTVTAHEREVAAGLLTGAYRAAFELVYKLGYGDLVLTAVDRLRWAASASGDPLAEGAAAWLRSWVLSLTGDLPRALLLLEQTRHDVHRRFPKRTPARISVIGSLHLRQAAILGRQRRLAEADDHIAEARELAQHLGVDGNAYLLAFGPSNVAIHSVAVAADALNYAEAIKRAKGVRLPARIPKERSSHHAIEVAHAYQQYGDAEGSVRCLQKARRIAPQHTRFHPMVHETVRALIDQRRTTGPVATFADWLRLTV